MPWWSPTLLIAAEGWVNYRVDYFGGRTIERLDLAALGPGAPVPPGISRRPGPGQYDVSPALAALLRTVPQAANPNYQGPYIGVVSCSVMRQLPVLGQCAADAPSWPRTRRRTPRPARGWRRPRRGPTARRSRSGPAAPRSCSARFE